MQWQQWTTRGAIFTWYRTPSQSHPPSSGYLASVDIYTAVVVGAVVVVSSCLDGKQSVSLNLRRLGRFCSLIYL